MSNAPKKPPSTVLHGAVLIPHPDNVPPSPEAADASYSRANKITLEAERRALGIKTVGNTEVKR